MVVWRDIPGRDGYQASSRGGVRSIDRIVKTANGQLRWYAGRVLSASSENQYGHRKVRIRSEVLYVHQLVALAFHGPRPHGLQVAHLDGDCRNNSPENLGYVSAKENSRQMREHGTHMVGESHPGAILTRDEVCEILWLRAMGQTQRAVAERFGVARSTVAAIDQGRSWA